MNAIFDSFVKPFWYCRFLKSETVNEFVGFIVALNDAVKGRAACSECEVSGPVSKMLDILKQLEQWLDEIPPVQQALRYGNPAYRYFIPSFSPEGEGRVICEQ